MSISIECVVNDAVMGQIELSSSVTGEIDNQTRVSIAFQERGGKMHEVKMDMGKFLGMVLFVLTNTDLDHPSDPRIGFLNTAKWMEIREVPSRQGGKTLKIQVPKYVPNGGFLPPGQACGADIATFNHRP